jgi:SAM-dependent methyltransferase
MTEEYVLRNRAIWDVLAGEDGAYESGRDAWARAEPTWGVWGVPETEVGMLEGVEGLDAVELGCGPAYVCAWLARKGARPIGLDNSPVQLANARRFQDEFGVRFPLVHGDAERTPFPDESFDLAISEYGAAIWCDPYRWIPEAARILRPGGRLVFLGNSYLCAICSPFDDELPIDEHLHRDHFGMHGFDWSDDDSTEFHIPHGEWIRLLRSNGFQIEDLLELRPPEGATETYKWVPLEWARRWPSEEVWKAGYRPRH